MSLWKFIESKLASLKQSERWLEDECGFAANTINRIRHGGTIKDGTKQKLALALGCSIGDINAAIAERDLPQPKPEYIGMGVGEIPEEAKEVIDDFIDREPKKIPAEKIKWYPDQKAIETPIRGPLVGISEPSVTALAVGAYKDRLLGICLQQLAEAAEVNVEDATVIYTAIGRALLRELMS